MRFESGMIGCLIVVLAIGGAVFGNVLLSADTHTETVTKYDFKTEVTGLFDTDTSPQFFDYDISKNYTGYYTSSTIDGNRYYWGGATFTQTGVNNYTVEYKPLNVATTNKYNLNDLGLTTSTPPSGDLEDYVRFTYVDFNNFFTGAYLGSSTLSSLITSLSLEDYDNIIVKPTSDDLDDGIYFHSKDDYERADDYHGNYYWLGAISNYENAPDSSKMCMSCLYDKATGNVKLYSGRNAEPSTLLRILPLADVCINYKLTSESNVGTPAIAGESAIVSAYNNGIFEYMDISQGVRITGEVSP